MAALQRRLRWMVNAAFFQEHESNLQDQANRAFNDCFAEEGCTASCSVSAAMCGTNETPSIALIEQADQALYCAKEKNKGGYCLWKEP